MSGQRVVKHKGQGQCLNDHQRIKIITLLEQSKLPTNQALLVKTVSTRRLFGIWKQTKMRFQN